MNKALLLIAVVLSLGFVRSAWATDTRCQIADANPELFCHPPGHQHCTGGCTDPWQFSFCSAVGLGDGPVTCGLGPKALWSPVWGAYPGHACYARNGAGHTFQALSTEGAVVTCLRDPYFIPDCRALGCD